MKVSMLSMLCGCVANIILDPLLILVLEYSRKWGLRELQLQPVLDK